MRQYTLTSVVAPRAGFRKSGSVLAGLLWAVAAVVGLMPAVAVAQPGMGGPVVTAKALPQYGEVAGGGGGEVAVAVTIHHEPGWHTWPEEGVELPAEIAEFAIRTKIELGDGVPAGVSIASIQWPQPHPGEVPDVTGQAMTMTVPLYSDDAVAYVWLSIGKDVPAGALSVPIVVSFQSCNAQMCLAPDQAKADAKLTVASAMGAKSESDVFAGLKARDEVAQGSRPGLQDKPPTEKTPEDKGDKGGAGTPPTIGTFSLPSPKTAAGLAVLALVSIVGGAILNLTPCVLPVIPIKVLTLSKQAGGSRRKAVMLGLWMFLGVVMFWTAVGVPMAFVSSALDPSKIFGTWWISLGLGLVISLFGLGIMGLFVINLPQKAYMINPQVESPFGSFVFGIMTAILGLPCFGFVAGGLLAGAAALPATAIMTIFVGLGLGMGAPFLILSAYPSLLNFVPRTGPASELVKQIMGLLLIAAAAFFVAAGLRALLIDKPYLEKVMAWWAVSFFVFIAGFWLLVRTLQISKKAWPKVAMPLLAIVGVGLTTAFAIGKTNVAWREHDNGLWAAYSKEKLASALDSGKVVLVEFTADWCITCQAIKAGVLDQDPVLSRIGQDDVVTLVVDLTSSKAEGWAFLHDLGRTGIPTLAVYGPAAKTPLVYNAYTAETVLEAMDQAGGKQKSDAGAWSDFSETKLNTALSEGKVVAVEFTADWDITCRSLRHAVLDQEPVRSRLLEDDVVLMEANLTSSKAAGWGYLRDKLGRTDGGIPTLAVYGPETAQPIVQNAYTAETVLEAMDQAGGKHAELGRK